MTNIENRLAKVAAKLPSPAEATRVFSAIVDPRDPSTLGAAALEAKARAAGWSGRALLIDSIIVTPGEQWP